MSRGRKVSLAGLAIVMVILGGAGWYLSEVAPVATGYPAKFTCTEHFVTGRSVGQTAADLPDNPLIPLIGTEVDAERGTATSTLLGMWSSTAWFTPGLGCTLADGAPGFTALPELPAPTAKEAWPQGQALTAPGPGVDADALDAAIDRVFVEDDTEGRLHRARAVVVVHEGRLIAERYGDGFDADTPQLGWSMTKSVANAIVGRLVMQDRLAVDAVDLRERWSDDARAGITLDQLLRMTAGLAFEEEYEVNTDATRMLFTPQDMGAFAASKPLAHGPGEVFSYSSGASNIVCDVAQDAAGAGPALARNLVFEPLGMASAVLEPDVSGGLACSSFLYATPRDWARFGQWYLQDGVWEGRRLLPEGWVGYTTRPVPQDRDPEHPYGAHWWLNQGSDGGLRMPSVPADAYWASGFEGQQTVVIPSADVVVVRMGLSRGFDGIDWGLERLLLGVLDAVG